MCFCVYANTNTSQLKGGLRANANLKLRHEIWLVLSEERNVICCSSLEALFEMCSPELITPKSLQCLCLSFHSHAHLFMFSLTIQHMGALLTSVILKLNTSTHIEPVGSYSCLLILSVCNQASSKVFLIMHNMYSWIAVVHNCF